MIRLLVLAILFSGAFANVSPGAAIQLNLPSEGYVPGEPVALDVRLPDITDLGSYNIDLVLESNTGTAGSDFFFDVAATVPAPTNYVFPSDANYFDAANVDSPMRHRITLSDFDLSGVNVVSGVNDRVASVVFRTAPTYHGQLTLFVDAPGLILDTPDVDPTPVAEFATIQSDTAAAPDVVLDPVPEPAHMCYFAAWVALLVRRSGGRGAIHSKHLRI
jgi:hypothetical protein